MEFINFSKAAKRYEYIVEYFGKIVQWIFGNR